MKFCFTCLVALFLLVGGPVYSQTAKSAVIALTPAIDLATPKVTLTWPNSNPSTFLVLFRREKDSPDWYILLEETGSTTNSFVDNQVVVGQTYEYGIQRQTGNVFSAGYVMVPLEAPVVDSRGNVAVFVEQTLEAPLTTELERFRNDLIGDGWVVQWHSVPANATVATVKSQVVADHNAVGLDAIFLFGEIPVPYSGNAAWDGHDEHQGAWPADNYYGDINNDLWTDASVNTNTNPIAPARSENINVPGDGKFDQDIVPISAGVVTAVEIPVGRVDFSNLSFGIFGASELELYRRYLNKNHNWRSKQFTVPTRAIVDDNFGYFGGEAFAANGYRNGNPLVGPANVFDGDFFNDTGGEGYLFGYGCGPGTYTSAGGVGTSGQFGADTVNIVFAQVFGSYHGDWDYSPDPFMMSALASRGGILTCSWAGRPHWFTHHLGAGETMGYSTIQTQNACDIPGYFNLFGDCGTHVSLVGDPTVRAQIVAPVSNVAAVQLCDEVRVTWAASPQPNVVGYHVYRSNQFNGFYERISADIVTSLNFTDELPEMGNNSYAVKAVVREVTPSGIFYNTSTGIITSISVGTTSPPTINLPTTVTLTCNNPSYQLNNPCGPGVQCQVTGPGVATGQFPVTLSQPGAYTVSAFDPSSSCSAMATLNVGLSNTPPASPTGSVGTINCSAQTVQLFGTSNPTGVTYAWTGPNGYTSNQQNPTVSAGGNYTLTVTSVANGCASSINLTVPSPAAPNASATGGNFTCVVTSVQLMGASTTSNVGYGWVGPNGFTSSQQNPTVSAIGNYVLTVTASNGCTGSATTTVGENTNLPVVNAGADFSLTCSEPSVTVDLCNAPYTCSLTNSAGAVLPLPAVIDEADTYTLTVTDPANGCTASDAFEVEQNTAPPAGTEASLGSVDCSTQTVQLLGSSGDPVSYEWTGPNGYTSDEQSPMVTASGDYLLTVTSSSTGCTATAEVVVPTLEQPNASATGGSLTCSITTTQLTGTTTTNNTTFSWTGPNGFTSTQQNPTVSVVGNYTFTVTATNGCTATATATVTQTGSNFPVANPLPSGVLTCLVQQVTIMANPGASGYGFSWTGPNGFTSTEQNPTVSEPGLYFVQVTNLTTGCLATYSSQVSEFMLSPVEPPILSSSEITCQAPIVTVDWPSVCDQPGYTCTLNGQPLPAQGISQAGSYILVITHLQSGCTITDVFDITPNNGLPNLAVNGDFSVDCAGESTTLTATSSTPGATIAWTGLPSGPTQTVPAGVYTVTATAPNGCSKVQTVVVSAPQLLILSVVATVNCDGFVDPDVIANGGTAPYTYVFSPMPPFPPNSNYNITVTDFLGCTASFMGTTEAANVLQATVSSTDETVAGENDGTATAQATGGDVPYVYLWSTNQTTATITDLAPGTYTCTVTDANGCTDVVSATVDPGLDATHDLPGLRSLILSPNPTGGRFKLSLALENPLAVQVQMLDVTGRVLTKTNLEKVLEKTWEFDLTHSPSGVYFCKITAEGSVAVVKVVKN